MTAMAKAPVDPKKYARLLSRALPAVIETEAENERLLAEVERLMDKGEANLTPEESKLFALMVKLIEGFEEQAYPIGDVPPHQMLQHLMEARGLKQADLLPIFGSRGYTSDIVNGKRGISKEHALRLAKFFHVSPELFIREADEALPSGTIIHWGERDPQTRRVPVTCGKCQQKRSAAIRPHQEKRQWTGLCPSCAQKRG